MICVYPKNIPGQMHDGWLTLAREHTYFSSSYGLTPACHLLEWCDGAYGYAGLMKLIISLYGLI